MTLKSDVTHNTMVSVLAISLFRILKKTSLLNTLSKNTQDSKKLLLMMKEISETKNLSDFEELSKSWKIRKKEEKLSKEPESKLLESFFSSKDYVFYNLIKSISTDLAKIDWSLSEKIVGLTKDDFKSGITNLESYSYWHNLGIEYLKDLRNEKSIECFNRALELKPDYHEVIYNKGNALTNLGRYEEAIAEYDKALAVKPDYHDAMNNKGAALYSLGRYEEAIAEYDKALALKPDYHDAMNNKKLAQENLDEKS